MERTPTLAATFGTKRSYKWIEMQPKQSTVDFILHFAATYDAKKIEMYHLHN